VEHDPRWPVWLLAARGYTFTFDPDTPHPHVFGFPSERPRRYHLHISREGSGHRGRVVAVRDYPRADEATAYEAEKRRIVAGTFDFVVALEGRALAW
jgi:hypothetical protein